MKASEENEKPHMKIALTSLSAIVAESMTFPIDITKTRLQLHGESLASTRPTNAFRVASEIIQREGSLGIYKGLSPAILRHLFYTPIRIVGYEHLRNAVSNDSLSGKAFIGGISGVIAQVVASPADLVKVRMQADGRLVSQGLHPRYTGPFDALNKIVRKEGFRGLWQGVVPNVQRAFLVNMGELACYDHAKRFVIQNQVCEDNIYAHTLASIMSGLSATTLSCPADVVKTRMMNQAAGKEARLLEMITWSQLGIHNKPIGLLNVDGYYNYLKSLQLVAGLTLERDGEIRKAALNTLATARPRTCVMGNIPKCLHVTNDEMRDHIFQYNILKEKGEAKYKEAERASQTGYIKNSI